MEYEFGSLYPTIIIYKKNINRNRNIIEKYNREIYM